MFCLGMVSKNLEMATYFSQYVGEICKSRQSCSSTVRYQGSTDINVCGGFTLVHAFVVDEHKHSPARMRRSNIFCTLRTELQTDAAPMLLWSVGFKLAPLGMRDALGLE